MVENNSKPLADPAWLRPMPRLWETFLIHFRQITGWTLLAMVLAAGVSLLLPKTYRSNSTLMILPPRFSANLEVPTRTLSLPAVQAVATSYPVLQDLLADLIIKRTFVMKVETRLDIARESPPIGLGSVLTRSASEAALFLSVPWTPEFEEVWSGMPPENLAKGFEDIHDRDLESLDPVELSEFLSARIATTMETNLTTQYQPLLTLSADWRSPESAALLSYLWAQAVLRALDEEILATTLQVQSEKVTQLSNLRKNFRTIHRAPFEFLAYHPLDIWKSEQKGLHGLSGLDPTQDQIEADKPLRENSLEGAQEELNRLKRQISKTSDEFHYALEGSGGLEALMEDYSNIFRAQLLGIPQPPKQKIAPRRAVIVLVTGAIFFLLILGSAQVSEIRRS